MSINQKEIVSKDGAYKMVLKESITYGDNERITSIYLDDKLSKSEIKDKADKAGIESAVISINGTTENLYENFKKLPLLIAREFIIEIKKILDPKVEEKS